MTGRDLILRMRRALALSMRAIVCSATAAWRWARTPRYRYLLVGTNVYRVPSNITPDLVMMYLEGVNCSLLAEQSGSRRRTTNIREVMTGLLTVDQMMVRLGFQPTFVVERLGTEV